MPRASIEPSGRVEPVGIAKTVATASKTATKPATGPCRRGLRRLGQGPDVADDRLDLVIVEALAKSRHAGRLALLDLADDEIVALVGAGKLGTAAGSPAASLMAPSARCREQAADFRIDRRSRLLGRGRSWLRGGRGLVEPREILKI